MRIVVDASIAVAWAARNQATALTDAAASIVVEEGALVPAHFEVEVVNSLMMLERRGNLAMTLVEQAMQDYAYLEIHVDRLPQGRVAETILPLAIRHSLTVYDAAYLELALRTGLPLATRDRDLTAAAIAAGAPLLSNDVK